jgi:arylsulfatase A-like enzyme
MTATSPIRPRHCQLTLLLLAPIAIFCGSGVADDNPTAALPRKPNVPPNVVVFLADDAGWGDYGHSGNLLLRTPAIDSIANSGVSFDRFFVCPVCAPTRAEFLTGRYHPRGGVRGVSTGQERLDLSEKTLADSFHAAGYATGVFGKWHNGSQWPYHPMARGFHHFFGHSSGHWGEYFNAPLEDNGRMVRTEGYIVDVCTARADDFISRNRDRPFFCLIPFTTPHSPWAVPAADWDRFRTLPITQSGLQPDRENIDETRCVLAMMEHQDRCVGQILHRLQQLNLRDNTIVLYFSDNGPNTARWNGGMRGQKGTTDEGGTRSVCFLSWPARIPAGRRITPIAGAIDLLPTLTALAGIPRVGQLPLDGHDLSGLCLGTTDNHPARILFTHWAGRVSARTQQFRLDAEGRLYDMHTDPGQTTAVNDRHPEQAAALQQAVRDWRQQVLRDDSLLKLAKRAGNAVDPRPFPVGYPEFPTTFLPARDAEPRGAIRRSSPAPNCSYFVNWKSIEDRIVWHIHVETSGTYTVSVDYTCPEADAGSVIELHCGESRLRSIVQPGWDPPLFTNQDTLPRPHGESPMKDFRTLVLGDINLSAGDGDLVLQAVQIPRQSVMDLRRLTLTLRQGSSQ